MTVENFETFKMPLKYKGRINWCPFMTYSSLAGSTLSEIFLLGLFVYMCKHDKGAHSRQGFHPVSEGKNFPFFKPIKRSKAKFYHVNLNNLCMSHDYKTPDQFIQHDSRDEIWIWNVLNQNGKKSACKLGDCLYCQGQVPTCFSAHDVNQKYWEMFRNTNSIASQHSILFMCQANKKTL